MTKIIKEMLPPDVRVARDAQDLLIECCVGEYIMALRWLFCALTKSCHLITCFGIMLYQPVHTPYSVPFFNLKQDFRSISSGLLFFGNHYEILLP